MEEPNHSPDPGPSTSKQGPAELGFNEKFEGPHRIIDLFRRDKSAQTKAMRPTKTTNTAVGYLSKVIKFVHSRIPNESRLDDWDFLRYPSAHRSFLQALKQSTLSAEGRDNYRKTVAKVIIIMISDMTLNRKTLHTRLLSRPKKFIQNIQYLQSTFIFTTKVFFLVKKMPPFRVIFCKVFIADYCLLILRVNRSYYGATQWKRPRTPVAGGLKMTFPRMTLLLRRWLRSGCCTPLLLHSPQVSTLQTAPGTSITRSWTWKSKCSIIICK